ncbi:hypothetical protein P8452_05625 [Trifolium repens]|nr:hypothetical protein P8452_05625 [Trifolium repens]
MPQDEQEQLAQPLLLLPLFFLSTLYSPFFLLMMQLATTVHSHPDSLLPHRNRSDLISNQGFYLNLSDSLIGINSSELSFINLHFSYY